jgi:DNA polymerase III delta prime subunit
MPKLIGPAARAIAILRVKFQRLNGEKRALKALLYGPPGTGKTEVAMALAREIAGHSTDIMRVNGKEITLEFVRGFKDRLRIPSLFGGTTVLLADECDRMTADARDLMLSVLDLMPHGVAFIGTSNEDMISDSAMKTERFQTRLQPIPVGPPSEKEIADYLGELFPGIPAATVAQIAQCSQGNVRAAVLDAENFLDFQEAAALAA